MIDDLRIQRLERAVARLEVLALQGYDQLGDLYNRLSAVEDEVVGEDDEPVPSRRATSPLSTGELHASQEALAALVRGQIALRHLARRNVLEIAREVAEALAEYEAERHAKAGVPVPGAQEQGRTERAA